jgi:hypothetical protein
MFEIDALQVIAFLEKMGYAVTEIKCDRLFLTIKDGSQVFCFLTTEKRTVNKETVFYWGLNCPDDKLRNEAAKLAQKLEREFEIETVLLESLKRQTSH